MKGKRRDQPLTPAQQARREADDFLWHFRLLKLTPFSHNHWWLAAAGAVPLEAGLWEFMRRHPDAKAARDRMHLDELHPPLVAFVGCHCRRTWDELSESWKAGFIRCLWKHYPAGHGFIAPPVTVLNDLRRFRNLHQRLEMTGQKSRLAESEKRLTEHVQASALESHHAGQILIAVNSNAPRARIANGVASAVTDWRHGQRPMDTGKSHLDQWLDVVAKFEKAELSREPSREHRDDQLFARYRRVIADWGCSRSDAKVAPKNQD